jgi:pimeloyl-ACP methyl ester carboxylesterase
VPVEVGSFVDGEVALSYEIHGRGRRVLLYMHGILLDTQLNHRMAADLGQRGYRVVLLDLPGHGGSAKPRHASAHRIDAYAHHVVRLMDHLGLERAVLGGTSLGANVTLATACLDPSRVQGMILEMPVLENATPVAALVFVPLLLAAHYCAPALRLMTATVARLPRTRMGPFKPYIAPLLMEPEETAAVLHGLFVGPVAPTVEQRSSLDIPALVIGHRSDRLHPFSDASKLATQLRRGRLVEARSIFELRHRPQRLTEEIAAFLDDVWPPSERVPLASA